MLLIRLISGWTEQISALAAHCALAVIVSAEIAQNAFFHLWFYAIGRI